MRKIPTVFERDWNGDRSRVLDEPVAECAWVFAGEGVARQKYDGSCCLIRGGVFYRRHEVRAGKQTPEGFEPIETDPETDKVVGWVPVGEGPEDRWHREALVFSSPCPDGTYELIGPKVQGNPERAATHELIAHAHTRPFIVPRNFEGMRDLLAELDVEGFVFHHPDGRMAKIKGKDFGLHRSRSSALGGSERPASGVAAPSPVRRIDVVEFREQGYLQELNRRFLHPLGLALEVAIEGDGSERIGGVWDFRDDPEGVYFDGFDLAENAGRVEALWQERAGARRAALGYMVQPAAPRDPSRQAAVERMLERLDDVVGFALESDFIDARPELRELRELLAAS